MSQEKRGDPLQVAEMERKIKQLEFIIDHLQQRIAQIAGSYELEVAIAKSEVHIQQLYGSEESD